MAIVFNKKAKKQNLLTITISLFTIVIVVFIFWQLFFGKEALFSYEEVFFMPPREVKINFQALEKSKNLQPFVEIEPFEEVPPTEDDPIGRELGRENPFLPY